MFKKLSLELGGKNATIVTDDIDIESVAKEVARASFLNPVKSVCVAQES